MLMFVLALIWVGIQKCATCATPGERPPLRAAPRSPTFEKPTWVEQPPPSKPAVPVEVRARRAEGYDVIMYF